MSATEEQVFNIPLTRRKIDFIASAMLFVKKAGKYTPSQEAEGKAIVDDLVRATDPT